jgi:Tol biopolymer transport system component
MNVRPTFGLALLAGVLVAVLLPALSKATGYGGNGEIAFSARVHGISQVFTIRPDGTRLRQVTHSVNDVALYGLTWSPNGRSLLYGVSYPNGNDRIFKSSSDGNGGATLISPPCKGTCLGDDAPSYSPDGKKIAFERAFGRPGRPASLVAIFTMNADGSHLTQLTPTRTPTNSEDHQPRWSPNGKEIAFVRLNTTAYPSGKSAIEVMNTDGSDARRLTPWQLEATDPRWSPDGKRILFRSYGEPIQFKDSNLFTMSADGTQRVALTHYSGGTLQAFPEDWSPDGTQIIFERFSFSGCCSKAGSYYILNLRSKQIRWLTTARIINYDAEAAWGK